MRGNSKHLCNKHQKQVACNLSDIYIYKSELYTEGWLECLLHRCFVALATHQTNIQVRQKGEISQHFRFVAFVQIHLTLESKSGSICLQAA